MSNIAKIDSGNNLKAVLTAEYIKQINGYFGDKKKALHFLSSVVAATQRIPELLECTPTSLVNSFMTMAQLRFMPSGVSGEAYVLPYYNKGVKEAQFQLGYPGIVTLLYRAGNREVIAELVREHDIFSISRGKITHEIDPRKTKAQRGNWIGTYAIITTANGGTVEGYMTREDILKHAQQFSKSFNSNFSPWKEENDPEGWMPRKTILKQVSKLAPKNEELSLAIAEDNKDSNLADRIEEAKEGSKGLTMGNALMAHDNENKKNNNKSQAAESGESETGGAK